jgi:hypothetical protein
MLIVDQGLEGIVDADGTLIRKQPEQMTTLCYSVDYLVRKADEPPEIFWLSRTGYLRSYGFCNRPMNGLNEDDFVNIIRPTHPTEVSRNFEWTITRGLPADVMGGGV